MLVTVPDTWKTFLFLYPQHIECGKLTVVEI